MYGIMRFLGPLILPIIILCSCGQSNKETRPSPYAIDSTMISGIKATIAYSSPGVKKRTIWGELVPYGNMWRTGANEATTFEISGDLILNGKLLEKGKYSVFTIPENQKWIVIFNNDWNQWGSYNYDEKNDALRLEVFSKKTNELQERMKFSFDKNELVFHWEYLQFNIAVERP